MSEIPKVLILKPITPSDKGSHLEYPNLAVAVEKHRPYESKRMSQFYDTEEDSLEEEEAARQLAMQYLLMTAKKQTEAVSEENKALWADRYTEASEELYGRPERTIAQRLLTEEYAIFAAQINNPNVDQEILRKVLEVYKPMVVSDSDNNNNLEGELLSHTSEMLRGYLNEEYKELFASVESGEKEVNTPDVIFEKFKKVLALLAENNPVWNEWVVELVPGKDSLSILPGKERKILVGADRSIATDEELKGLLAHEILVHAQRSVNGSAQNYELSSGLAGYLDFEEGLGTFFESAITGVVPQKIINRYVDISLALGILDGDKMPRAALLEFVEYREIIRQQMNNTVVDTEQLHKKVVAHVNRIYRGTSGEDGAIGVFTKDIVYYKGFCDVKEYFDEQLKRGTPIDEVVRFLLQGKFSPLVDSHIQYITNLQSKQ